ncbi:MAG: glycoside hydrolase family 92 protein [Clostridia bacterium]|nr:glycoside hydrolase family 92 protein [Clostridia bacterium]
MSTSIKKTDIVNVFQGNGEVKTKPREGIAKTWFFFKGLSGNTHPGAVLPFGKLSVCAHSGGYPSGYGNNLVNSGDPIRPLYDGKKIFGLAHLHHDGTGFIGYFYNYALTTAFSGALCKPEMNDLVDEVGRPGYYSATAKQSGVKYEGTTSTIAIYHRYTMPTEKDNRVMIDFSNDGLYERQGGAPIRFDAGEATLCIVDEHTVTASVVLQGLPLYFCAYCTGGKVKLWENYQTTDATELKTNGEGQRKFGCVFELDGDKGGLCLTISTRSTDKALADNIAARNADFDDVAALADATWEEKLSAIDIKTDDRNKEIFYSNFYHTLTKPSDWSGESFYYEDEDFLLDFITLWDIYKTQFPLLFMLYPEISRKLVRTYALMGERQGVMPNSYGLCRGMMAEANQARLLASYMFCDAYYRGVQGVDYPWAFRALFNETKGEQYKRFFETGECERTTHTLDLAECCGNVSDVADELGLEDISSALRPYAGNWRSAFDADTGVLKEGCEYYEGNHWNYAFRPLREMNARVDEFGGREKFEQLLDRFFGYTHEDSIKTRFEGFNNETDMEAPYAYAWAARHDKLCEVVSTGMRCMFTTGEGGVPGNCDSGGLSSCYVWNVMGIFPVSGQDLVLIGSPCFERTTMTLASGNTFTIKREGKGIYVKHATLDGEPLKILRLSVRRMMTGGTLTLDMTENADEAMKQ